MQIPVQIPVTKAAPQIQKTPKFALFALGFRPFYLAAALFAVIAVAWWWAELNLSLAHPAHLPGLLWHSHEMVYGFVMAVVAGFFLTASQTWTGVAAPKGFQLVMIVAVWLAGRVAMWWYGPWSVWIDVLFLPLVAIALSRILLKASNRRNYFFVALLMLFAVLNALFHASVNGWLTLSAIKPLHAALFLVVVLISIVGGRVMPMFTANAILGVKQYKRGWLDTSAIALTVLGLILFVVNSGQISALVLLLGAAAHTARLLGWGALSSYSKPILWVLHISYAWIPVGLILLALSALGLISASAAIHALAIGAAAGMIVGMMTRTSRGHTGRQMKAGIWEIAAYGCVHLGALTRVAASLVQGELYLPLIAASAVLWISAFALFLAVFAPMLTRPRLDGKTG